MTLRELMKINNNIRKLFAYEKNEEGKGYHFDKEVERKNFASYLDYEVLSIFARVETENNNEIGDRMSIRITPYIEVDVQRPDF